MRKALIMLFVCLFAFGCLSMATFAAEVDAIDLSSTATGLILGDTSKSVIVKGVTGTGNNAVVGEQINSGVTFVSSNEDVLTVDAAGKMTPVSEGMSIITATYSGKSQNIVVVVYKKIAASQTFDTQTAANVSDIVSYNKPVKYTYKDSYEFVSDIKRNGAQSIHLKDLNPGDNTDKLTTDGGAWVAVDIISGDVTSIKRGITELWFYDEDPSAKNDAFMSLQNGTLRGFIGPRENDYYTHSKDQNTYGFSIGPNKLPRSKGWHQFVIDYTRDYEYLFYIDGQLLSGLNAPNIGFSGIRLVRSVSGSNSSIYFDDYYVYDVEKTAASAPIISELTISGKATTGITLTTSYRYFDANYDAEDKTKTVYQWEISDNGIDGWNPISGATGSSYTIKEEDANKYIRVSVTAKSAADETSNTLTSEPTGLIEYKPDADTVVFSSIGFSSTKTVFKPNDPAADLLISGWGEYGEYNLTGDSRTSVTVSDSNVVDISGGKITPKRAGCAMLTLTFTNIDNSVLTKRILVVVGTEASRLDFESTTDGKVVAGATKRVEDIVRSGQYALKVHNTKNADNKTYYGVDTYRNRSIKNNVYTAWFYDSGEKTNAKATVTFSDNGEYKGTGNNDVDPLPANLSFNRTVGIGNDTSDYYTLNGTILDGTSDRAEAKRSRGWHQVVCIQYNTDPEDQNRFAINHSEIYIDGLKIYESNERLPVAYLIRGLPNYNDTAGEKGSYYDDFSIYEYKMVPITLTVNGDGGVIKDGGNPISSIAVPNGSSKTFTFVPDSGYEVDSVSVNGAPQPKAESVTLDNITEDTTVTVSFVQKGQTVPSITNSGAPLTTNDPFIVNGGEISNPSVIHFSTVQEGYGYRIVRFGMELRDGNNVIQMDVADENTTSDGKFGVRAFGNGLESGKTYTLVPYVIYEDADSNEQVVYGTPQAFTMP